MRVTGQWFYRPEEAESVMHKCPVHFVPIHKQLPNRKQHPGFQKVYDTIERKRWKLTDKDYEDNKQHEIDLLVQKTQSHIGDLLDIETEDNAAEQPDDQSKFKRTLRKKNVAPIDDSREEEASSRHDNLKAETPRSCVNNQFFLILEKFNALTGDTPRDKWLERLLQCIQCMCSSPNNEQVKVGFDGTNHETERKMLDAGNEWEVKNPKSGKTFLWPDDAVNAVTALEKVSRELSSDFQKYNQKLRSLQFNLKNSTLLAQHLLNGELKPSKILDMSPNELKD